MALLKQQVRYSLLLMDIQLPDSDGISLTPQIRQHQAYDRMTIVSFSSYVTRANVNALLECGAAAFYQKPLSNDENVTLLGKLPSLCS